MKRRTLVVYVVVLAILLGLCVVTFITLGSNVPTSSIEIEDPENNPAVLAKLVPDEVYQESKMGEDSGELYCLNKSQINQLIDKVYTEEYKNEYEKQYKRDFKKDFHEYASIHYCMTSGRHQIGQPLIDLSKSDNALLISGTVTRDLIEKVTDLGMVTKKAEFGWDDKPFFERTRFLKEVREAERRDAESSLTKEPEKLPLDDIVPKDTLLPLDKKGKAVELKKQYIADRYVEELPKDFINTVSERNFSYTILEEPDLNVLPLEKLREVFDYGITGRYIVEINEFTLDRYISEKMYDYMIFLDFDPHLDEFVKKYKGFMTGSLRSGVSYRVTQPVGTDFSNRYILEVGYIPEITGFLSGIKYQDSSSNS